MYTYIYVFNNCFKLLFSTSSGQLSPNWFCYELIAISSDSLETSHTLAGNQSFTNSPAFAHIFIDKQNPQIGLVSAQFWISNA